MYAHSLKIGKPQSLKVFGASKPMVVDKTAVLTGVSFNKLYYAENASNTNPTKNRGRTQVLRKGK
jgi:hypothetical protein